MNNIYCKMDKICTSRNNFIKSITQRKNVKYIGQVHQEDLSTDSYEFYMSRVKGDEICIEFHLFEMLMNSIEVPMVLQFRLREEN